MNELIEHFQSKLTLSKEAEQFLRSIATEHTVSKGKVLIREGQKNDKIFFIASGCLRSYCTNKNGKEHTLQFGIKDWWISDYIALHENTVAQLSVECIKNAKVIELKRNDLKIFREQFPAFQAYQIRNLERLAVSLQKRILNQLQLSASERYDLFLKTYPNIEQDIANYHLASFLGIAQESLSRIRLKRIKEK
ncbi:MAG: hypothetical protein COB73_09855 [Flavobacteriaceae bacterium]|nr:MAG: hypothetical protein COB73_09855 [Flavobacteriaceae bacterium]